MTRKKRIAIIIGAGPAGLTAAHDLLEKTDFQPIILEMSPSIGGLSRTINFKGNRIDIGGHRFFSKSDEIMTWWLALLPLQGVPAKDDLDHGRKVMVEPGGPDPERVDRVMLFRHRLSRILYLRKFFPYPLSPSLTTLLNLGLWRTLKILASYCAASISPLVPEKNLEDFFINRFGRELYETFFKDYTEKVWGVSCTAISPDWGRQRIKGVSIKSTLRHALQRFVSRQDGIAQKEIETSLIEQFYYPKFGPGQIWEVVAGQVVALGGEILKDHRVTGLRLENSQVVAVEVENAGEKRWMEGDVFFSSMPVKDLIGGLQGEVPDEIRSLAAGLQYRDFMTVGLLVKRGPANKDGSLPKGTLLGQIQDNWIYVQERDVKMGRIQIFNNWSPYLVADSDNLWLGLEYFANEGDDLWRRSDAEMIALAGKELLKLGLIADQEILDGVVIRERKAYPAYFDKHDEFPKIIRYLDSIDNLFPVGRNGMHRYNNMDHSMLTAIRSVECLSNKGGSKASIWQVNAEEEYLEKAVEKGEERSVKEEK